MSCSSFVHRLFTALALTLHVLLHLGERLRLDKVDLFVLGGRGVGVSADWGRWGTREHRTPLRLRVFVERQVQVLHLSGALWWRRSAVQAFLAQCLHFLWDRKLKKTILKCVFSPLICKATHLRVLEKNVHCRRFIIVTAARFD